LPYQVNKAALVEKIASLVHTKKIDGIADLRDESDRDGIRVVIELKRDAIPEIVLNQLYKQTQMQSSFGIILLGILNNQPKVFTLKELLGHFIDHRKEVVVRRTQFDLARAKERAHILEGLVIALDNLDAVIKLIRAAVDPPEAKAGLMEKFGLSALQAQAILDMRLQRLTGLERDKILEEYRELQATIAHLEEILRSDAMVEDIVIEELEAVKAAFGDVRRTEIVDDYSDIEMEDLIVEEDMVITVTRGGYIKRTALTEYRAQRRGGRGKVGMATKSEDEVWKLFVASTHATMLFFTNTGRVFSRKVYELPQVAPNAKGRAMVNLLRLGDDERIETLLAVRNFDDKEDQYLFFATRMGRVKRTALSEFENIRTNGLRAVTINEGDDLLTVHLTAGNSHVFMGTHRGRAIRFHEDQVRSMGRTAAGVRGITIGADDWVEEVASFEADSEADILVVTDQGFGKRTLLSEFRVQGRGGKGIILIRLTEKNGMVAGIRSVTEADQVLLVTEKGIVIRTRVEEIRQAGRATQGVRVIRVGDGDKVVSVAKVVDADEDEPIDDDSLQTEA
ncbi:MAG: DNA gyrase C-terminal beta-propeller domain-containing protein, partial [Acidobacteriota bacterium]